MTKYILTLSLVGLCLTVTANTLDSTIDGTYDCSSTNVGKDNKSQCEMKLFKTGETFAMEETCADGNSYLGTGILNKNKISYSFVFVNTKKSDEVGVAAVNVGEKGTLNSQWSYLGKKTLDNTYCTKK